MSNEPTHDLAPPKQNPNAWVDVLVGLLIRGVLVTALVVGVIWGLRWWSMQKPTLGPDAEGKVELTAKAAELHGNPQIRYNVYDGQPNIGWWDNPGQTLSWKTKGVQPGKYEVLLSYSRAPEKPLQLAMKAGEGVLVSDVASTGGWNKWGEQSLGEIEIGSEGASSVTLSALTPEGGEVVNFVKLVLRPVGK